MSITNNIIVNNGRWGCEFLDTFDHEPLVVLFKETEYKYEKINMLNNVFVIEFRYRRLLNIDDRLKSSLRRGVENFFARKFDKLVISSIFYVLNFEGPEGATGKAKMKITTKNNKSFRVDCSYGQSEEMPDFMGFSAISQKQAVELFFAFLNDEVKNVQILPINKSDFNALSFDIKSDHEELNTLAHRAAQQIGYKINTEEKVYADLPF